jgi:hypothetical protein
MKALFARTVSVLLLATAAHASIVVYTANLNGPNENPPQPLSPGIGFAIVTVDNVANTLRVQVNFSGLLGNTTASHIHCCVAAPGTAGVATVMPAFPGFPLGVTSGTDDATLDMTLASSYNPAFITASGGTALSAETVLFAGLAAGQTYFNIHTTFAGGGEIRGFLVAVPEPGTLVLAAVALVGFVMRRRRR